MNKNTKVSRSKHRNVAMATEKLFFLQKNKLQSFVFQDI